MKTAYGIKILRWGKYANKTYADKLYADIFWNKIFPGLKKVLVRFEPRIFALPDVFITSRLSVPDTLRNLNLLWTKIPSESVKKVVTPKKSNRKRN